MKVGARVRHIPSGLTGVVVRVYDDALLVEVGRGDYRRWPMVEWKKEEGKCQAGCGKN